MKVLALSIVVLLIWVPIKTDAAVIGGDYNDDIVAVYHFNEEITEGIVRDYGVNAVAGDLNEGATLTDGKYGQCLSLPTKAADFFTFDPHIFLDSHNKFSIVAWVKIPNQTDDFRLGALALDSGDTENIIIGSVYLAVEAGGNLEGSYRDIEDDTGLTIATTTQNISDDTWNHIALTVSRSQMKFYLNGEPLGSAVDRTRYISFSGIYTAITIGHDAIGLVDDVGFFSDTFSDANIKLIYDVGLEKIISIASVEPDDKMTTTWGKIKSQR